jgi:transketolase
MTVIDVADAVEIGQAVRLMVDLPGPAYLRLKRGEIPVMFGDEHELSLDKAQILTPGDDVALVASGMMVSTALAAAVTLADAGVSASVVNVPVIKPLDRATILGAASSATAVVTAENHSVVGGLGSAVAEVLAEAGLARRLRRVGLQDTFAEGAHSAASLFLKYGLGTQDIVDQAWSVLGRPGASPRATTVDPPAGAYSPV